MINFSKDSWHYHFLTSDDWWNSHLYSQYRANLCPYVRRLTGMLIVTLLCCIVVGLAAFSATIAPIYWFLGFPPVTSGIGAFIAIGFLLWTVVGLIAAMFAVKYVQSKMPAKEKKEPSVVVEWIKAKHDKFCPRIDFK